MGRRGSAPFNSERIIQWRPPTKLGPNKGQLLHLLICATFVFVAKSIKDWMSTKREQWTADDGRSRTGYSMCSWVEMARPLFSINQHSFFLMTDNWGSDHLLKEFELGQHLLLKVLWLLHNKITTFLFGMQRRGAAWTNILLLDLLLENERIRAKWFRTN